MGKVKFQFANFKQAAAYSKWFVSQTFSFIALPIGLAKFHTYKSNWYWYAITTTLNLIP